MTDREARQAAREQQAAVLRIAGFGPPISMGSAFGGTELVPCLTCGALIPLTLLVEGEAHPLDLHVAWHKKTEATS